MSDETVTISEKELEGILIQKHMATVFRNCIFRLKLDGEMGETAYKIAWDYAREGVEKATVDANSELQEIKNKQWGVKKMGDQIDIIFSGFEKHSQDESELKRVEQEILTLLK